MITLLPYPDYSKSAEVLDDRRLNKQRSDVVQILKRLAEPEPPEGDHHAVKMWRGNEPALIRYGMVVCMEYAARGNNDATLKKVMEYRSVFEESSQDDPEWMNNEEFHTSHRSHLLRLLPSHYRRFWPDLTDELSVIWPRSPLKQTASAEQREANRLHKKAVKAKENLEKAYRHYEDACADAGIDPETFEYLDGAQVVEIAPPDPDVANL